MRGRLVVISLGWTLACAGGAPLGAEPVAAPDPVVAPPPPPREARVQCCRMQGIRGFVHDPRADPASCLNVGAWVDGRECEPTCCCRTELADLPFVRSTADWCADLPERECRPLDDPGCG